MTEPLPTQRMTADEFLIWSMRQPKGERYELVDGEIVSMAAERLAHAQTKFEITLALRAAIKAQGLPCEALVDGMAVQVDAETVLEPDALVRCGPPLPGDTVRLTDPVIVVEVVSPSSVTRDGAKLEEYFRLPSVRHYLIVRTNPRTVIHHRRDGEDRVQTRIIKSGWIELDPPGLAIEMASFFPQPL